jgi:hypothetical protein
MGGTEFIFSKSQRIEFTKFVQVNITTPAEKKALERLLEKTEGLENVSIYIPLIEDKEREEDNIPIISLPDKFAQFSVAVNKKTSGNQSIQETGFGLDNYVKQAQELSKTNKSFKVIELCNSTLSGQPARKAIYLLGEYKIMEIRSCYQGKIHRISFMTWPQNGWDLWSDTANQMIDSFRFI